MEASITLKEVAKMYDNQMLLADLTFGITNVYPNPFNPLVNFNIELENTENINIYIYDLMGH